MNLKVKHKGTYQLVAIYKGKEVGRLKYVYPGDPSGKRNIGIDWIEVNEEYRRKGVGTMLLKAFIEEMQKKGVLWISFWTGKDLEEVGGYSFYEKMGFKKVYIQEDYFNKDVPTRLFVMRLR